MDASSLNHHGVSCAPYLALKHVEGSDRPVFFYNVSEKKKVDDVNKDDEGELKLTNSNCWATPQGWVLVRDAPSSNTYLVDPHNATDTAGRIPLPHLPAENLSTYCTCLLSDYYPAAGTDAGQGQTSMSSSSSCCIVLLVETDAPVIWYCRVDGGEEWARHEYDIGTLQHLDGSSEKLVICPIAACGGKFYFNGCDFTKVGVLEFCRPAAPVFSSIVTRHDVEIPKGLFQKTFMVESMGELYMVCLASGFDLDVVHRISVHKMDFDEGEWVQVDSIGGRVFLLSSWYFGASRSADELGLQPNCLYVLYPWNKRMRVFNVQDGTTKMQDLDGAPASDQALWMLPTHP